jgi:hypothetical protein
MAPIRDLSSDPSSEFCHQATGHTPSKHDDISQSENQDTYKVKEKTNHYEIQWVFGRQFIASQLYK